MYNRERVSETESERKEREMEVSLMNQQLYTNKIHRG